MADDSERVPETDMEPKSDPDNAGSWHAQEDELPREAEKPDKKEPMFSDWAFI